MRIRLAVPDAAMSPDVLDAALEAVTRTNEHLLKSGAVPHADEAIAAGVKWQPEPPGDEHFDHAAKVIKRGFGDCDDLAPYKAASLRITGEDPDAQAIVLRSGPKRWHAVVARSDGSIDDPSADAGMYEYHAPIQPRLHGDFGKINIATKQVAGVWCSRVDVPWKGSNAALSGHGFGSDVSEAIVNAIEGPALIGDAAGVIEPEHAGKLCVIHGVLCGDDLDGIAHAVRRHLTPQQFRAAAHAALQHGPSAALIHKLRASQHHAQGDELEGVEEVVGDVLGHWAGDVNVARHHSRIAGFYQ